MIKQAMFAGLCLAGSLTACATDPTVATDDQALSDSACPASMPAGLAPAADQDLAFTLHATGVQIYSCTNGAWAFIAPDAQLYEQDPSEPVGHHFACPTCQFDDGSSVVGAKVAAATVDPTAIPWLLLTAKSHGPIDGRMTDVTSIQRLETTGGNSPAGPCTTGDVANVPYTATYFFYTSRHANNPELNTRCGG